MAGLGEEAAAVESGGSSGVIFHASEGGGLHATEGPYNPGNLKEIDRAIRHMPGVVAYVVKKAQEGITLTGADSEFAVVLQNDPTTQRPRAYMAPNTSDGIHLELSQGVLLKAAVSMQGR